MAWEITNVTGCQSYQISPSLLTDSNLIASVGGNAYSGSRNAIISSGTKYDTPTGSGSYPNYHWTNILALSASGAITTYIDYAYEVASYIDCGFLVRRSSFSDWRSSYSAALSAPYEIGLVFAIDRERQYGGILFVFDNPTADSLTIAKPINSTYAAQNWYKVILGNEVPIYHWTAWNQLNGNSGGYKCNLTMIDPDELGNFMNQYVAGDADDFDRITGQSDIWGIFQNMSFNTEKIIAYSGNAYLTLTVTAVSGLPTHANFTYKFYSNTDTLLYTLVKEIAYTGGAPLDALYLSFVYDNDNQVAVFLPVEKSGSLYGWGNHSPSETEMNYIWLWLQMSGAGSDERPYDTGTTDNGGQPTDDILTNDDMPTVTLPLLGAMQSKLFTVYCPSDNDLEDIADFLWDSNVLTNFKKYFNNFSDNLIALYVLPYKPSNLPTKAFTVGGLTSDTITAVEYIQQRFVTIDMGEVSVGDVWDSYLDFAPYTRFNIYLPGIGVQALDADDIMAPLDSNKRFGDKLGSTIKLEYVLDLMTGICVAYIKINGHIRYQFSGKLGYQIPLTGENYNAILHAFSVASTGLVSTLATGGAAAPFAATSAVTAITNAMKPDVYRGGNLSGNASSLSYPTPYLIRRIPNKPELVNQDKFTGFQSYKSGKLRDFGGYTEVVEVHAEGFVCTEEERSEIIELLKKGVIL